MAAKVLRTFTSQLIVMQTAEYAGEIRAYAGRSNRSLSTLLREALEVGWPSVRRVLILESGEITPAQRLHGEVQSIMPAADRPAYEAARRGDVLRSAKDRREYGEITSPAPVGAE
jgi:hypothetical protein